jgi:hypothetical protein
VRPRSGWAASRSSPMPSTPVVGCEDIIGSLAAKRFHNSNKETEKAHAFQRFYANSRTKGREKGDQKSNSRAKKLEFGIGLA